MKKSFLDLKSQIPDHGKNLKSYNNRLSRPIYEERIYVEDGNHSVSLYIYQRIEGSRYFVFSGGYGVKENHQETLETLALNAIDALFDENHIMSADYRHFSTIAFEHREELHGYDQGFTARDGHELMKTLLEKHAVPTDDIHAWHLNFNGWRCSFSQEDLFVRIRDYVPAPSPINQDYGESGRWLSISRGYIDDKLIVYLKSFSHQSFEGGLQKMWAFADDVLNESAEEYLADTSRATDKYSWISKFKGFDEAAKTPPTQEQIESRRRYNEMTNLSSAYSQGIDVRALLQQDPRFNDQEVDEIMAEMGSAGLLFNEMVAGVAGVIEKAIQPIEDNESLDELGGDED